MVRLKEVPMRKTLLTLTALAGLAGLGALTPAARAAEPVATGFDAAMVQPAQYYGGGYDRRAEWRRREWRHHEWERHHHWHYGYRG
jgi:hypothetical protein